MVNRDIAGNHDNPKKPVGRAHSHMSARIRPSDYTSPIVLCTEAGAGSWYSKAFSSEERNVRDHIIALNKNNVVLGIS